MQFRDFKAAEGEMSLRELVLHVVKTASEKAERADLTRANLRGANLTDADLTRANLRGANLTDANLTDADLTDANVDYCGWPLRCSSLSIKVSDNVAAQLLFHAFAVARINPTEEQIEFIKNFHRFDECKGVETLTKVGATP